MVFCNPFSYYNLLNLLDNYCWTLSSVLSCDNFLDDNKTSLLIHCATFCTTTVQPFRRPLCNPLDHCKTPTSLLDDYCATLWTTTRHLPVFWMITVQPFRRPQDTFQSFGRPLCNLFDDHCPTLWTTTRHLPVFWTTTLQPFRRPLCNPLDNHKTPSSLITLVSVVKQLI